MSTPPKPAPAPAGKAPAPAGKAPAPAGKAPAPAGKAPAPAGKAPAPAPGAKGPAPAGAKPTGSGGGAIPGVGKPPAEKKEFPCFTFTFDSRSKPQTELCLQTEAKRMKGLFSKKPKVPIAQMVTLLDNKTPEGELNKALKECWAFYFYDEKMGEMSFDVLGRLYLEAAGKETTDSGYQKYLLYRAVDLFSTSVNLAPKRLNVNTESMIVSVFKILTPMNSSSYYIEKEIHNTMNVMLNQKKDPSDLEARDKIIKLCFQGKRFYEAYYHLIEMEKIMQLKSRSMYLLKAGELSFKKATVFQFIIDFYMGVAGNKEQKEIVVDMGKLQAFIMRFNLENKKAQIIPLTGTKMLAINKTVSSLMVIANTFYAAAAADVRFSFRHKAYYCIAHNNIITDKVKIAIQNLMSALDALAKSNLKQIDKGNEKLKLLEQIIKIYTDQGATRKAEEFQKQVSAIRDSVRKMESKKRDEDRQHKEDNADAGDTAPAA